MVEYIGWLAVLLFIISGLQRCPKITIAFAVAGNSLFTLKYFILGMYSPCILTLCNNLCGLALIFSPAQHRKIVAAISFSISGSFMIYNYSHAYDILILFAALMLAFGQINMHCYIKYKIGAMSCLSAWIVYSIFISDPAMLTTCAIAVASHFISLIKNLHKDIQEQKIVISPRMYFVLAPLFIAVVHYDNIAALCKNKWSHYKLQRA